MDNRKTGALIRERRQELGLTQAELAERLHVTDRAVSKWERGLNAPDIALLEPLSEALGLTVLELIQGERKDEGEHEPPSPETGAILDYSRQEIRRKVGHTRKKYLGLLVGVLVFALLVGGALLWRSGVLFLLDTKPSPDGESVVRVYSKSWDFWPLRFTTEDSVQLVGKIGESVGGGNLYSGYPGGTYEGLWWSPDSTKFVVSFHQGGQLWLSLDDLIWNHTVNLTAVTNPYWNLVQAGLAPAREDPPEVKVQFLQWGKDSDAMLLSYSYEDDSGVHEGYFWFHYSTGQVDGIVELEQP